MLERSQLPHLIKLLDDPTPTVRNAVLDALAAFGPDLTEALTNLPEPPAADAVQRVNRLLAEHLWGCSLLPAVATPECGNSTPCFRPGQIVRHKRYGYRGVVVELDPVCRADDNWYNANQTQPEREQPWYHVLVHESMQVTYAAQTSLEPDDSGEEVVHPYVPYFFSEFRDGEYIRNHQPWPT